MNASDANSAKLNELLDGFVSSVNVDGISTLADISVDVNGVSLDSRLLKSGDLYLAMAGGTAHGLEFLEAAIDNGAVAVVIDDVGLSDFKDALSLASSRGLPIFHVPELKRHAGEIAARFYQHPSRGLQIVAVTGTDGKTSVCRFIANALNGVGQSCGYIGTLGWGIGSLTETQLTTPDAVSIQKMMAELRDNGASVVALEASSHGLEEGRLDAVKIDVAVLTNFGRDHLDYHKNLTAYKKAKARLFSWPDVRAAVLNGQDELGCELAEQISCNSVVFFADPNVSNKAIKKIPTISLEVDAIELHSQGIRFGLIDNGEHFEQSSSLMGTFNVENLLACHGALRALGQSANDASASLSHVHSVPGRIEKFSGNQKPTAIVDYAHTPQALSAVIASVRKHCVGELWVVFGCGGDRDAGKRGPMGLAAEKADHIVVTDDNPRNEDSQSIINQIVAGMSQPKRAVVIADRGDAIAHALSQANSSDLVLIAGKGHEDYQIIGAERREFSDRCVVQRFMKEAV